MPVIQFSPHTVAMACYVHADRQLKVWLDGGRFGYLSGRDSHGRYVLVLL